MMSVTLSVTRQPIPSGMALRFAVAACIVIIHLLLIHSLHLMTSHRDAMDHHSPVGMTAPAGSIPALDTAGTDANCDAPDFVGQRLDITIPFVASATIVEITPDDQSSLTVQRSTCDLPRPPGPDRQAILQRFTL